jgi:hypothetical protein
MNIEQSGLVLELILEQIKDMEPHDLLQVFLLTKNLLSKHGIYIK